jgi:hypothetical protein
MTIGNIASISMAGKPVGNAVAWFIGASLIPLLYLVAGFRLRQGEGLIAGSLGILFFLLDFVFYSPATFSSQAIGSLLARVVLLILVVNGLRGVLALRTVDYNEPLREILR